MSPTKKSKKVKQKPSIVKIPKATSESYYYQEDINWKILRIMSEFVNGFQFLSELEKEVSFFGSGRLSRDNKYYRQAEALAYKLGKDGFTIITRGGPGIMEAANKGAYEAGAVSVGLNVELPKGIRRNKYLNKELTFNHYFTRKLIMFAAARAYVFFPGGYGTLDNFFELLTLIQTRKMQKIPVILIGKDYWNHLLKFIEQGLFKKYHTISAQDTKIYKLVDNIEKAHEIIKKTKERAEF